MSAGVVVPASALEVRAVRSSGPGGQNVNKVSSKAVLRWTAQATAVLSPAVKARLLAMIEKRLTKEGELVISCDETRDQAQNLAIAEERLRNLVRTALVPPKVRHKTRPSRGSKERRLKAKRVRSATKAGRGGGYDDD